MHDLLLSRQDHLLKPDLLAYAEELGLDVPRFGKELYKHVHAGRVGQDVESADISGVSGTPTFFVNGRRHYGAFDVALAHGGDRHGPRPGPDRYVLAIVSRSIPSRAHTVTRRSEPGR